MLLFLPTSPRVYLLVSYKYSLHRHLNVLELVLRYDIVFVVVSCVKLYTTGVQTGELFVLLPRVKLLITLRNILSNRLSALKS